MVCSSGREFLAAVILAGSGLLSPCVADEVRHEYRFSGLGDYVHAAMRTWEVPGLAIIVIKDGQTVLCREFGECEMGSGRSVDSQTLFPIASCLKPITASAIALLVDDGKLYWDDPVKKHLPEFESSDAYLTQHCTVRDLLCHRTGLRRADLLQDSTGFSRQEVLRRFRFLQPAAEFRTRLIYNNHTYAVLDELVERLSGQTFEGFVTQRLFEAMGISYSAAPDKPRRALRHWRSDVGIVSRSPSSTDGMFMTASDLAKLLQLHLNEGTYDGRQLISAESVHEMQALQFSQPVRMTRKTNTYAAQFYGAGLGWFVQDYRGRKVVYHTGAWGSVIGMIPDEKLGVVVLSNLDLESLPALLMYDVFDAYSDPPQNVWDEQKWTATWLEVDPPGIAYRPRDEAIAKLAVSRKRDSHPSLALSQYVGQYESPLYGLLTVRQSGDQLLVVFGEHETEMSHREHDSFYVRSPTRLTFDWLLTFDVTDDNAVRKATIKHIGWDKDEPDHGFHRVNER